MGLVIGQKDIDTYNVLLTGARSMYQVGDVTGDHRFRVKTTAAKPMDYLWKTFRSSKSGND
jgi:hypothetical protein